MAENFNMELFDKFPIEVRNRINYSPYGDKLGPVVNEYNVLMANTLPDGIDTVMASIEYHETNLRRKLKND